MSDRDRAKGAPIDLGTLARSKGECEKGRLSSGSDLLHIGFDDRIAAVKALFAYALQDLRGGEGIFFQHADNLRFKRIKLTSTRGRLAGSEVLLGQPVGNRAGIESEVLGDLRGVKPLLLPEVFDLTKDLIIDHERVSAMCLKMSLRTMGVSDGVILGV